MEGIFKGWVKNNNYGFISVDGFSKDVFLHISKVQIQDSLKEGDFLEFDIENTDKGHSAVNVKIIKKRILLYSRPC